MYSAYIEKLTGPLDRLKRQDTTGLSRQTIGGQRGEIHKEPIENELVELCCSGRNLRRRKKKRKRRKEFSILLCSFFILLSKFRDQLTTTHGARSSRTPWLLSTCSCPRQREREKPLSNIKQIDTDEFSLVRPTCCQYYRGIGTPTHFSSSGSLGFSKVLLIIIIIIRQNKRERERKKIDFRRFHTREERWWSCMNVSLATYDPLSRFFFMSTHCSGHEAVRALSHHRRPAVRAKRRSTILLRLLVNNFALSVRTVYRRLSCWIRGRSRAADIQPAHRLLFYGFFFSFFANKV